MPCPLKTPYENEKQKKNSKTFHALRAQWPRARREKIRKGRRGLDGAIPLPLALESSLRVTRKSDTKKQHDLQARVEGEMSKGEGPLARTVNGNSGAMLSTRRRRGVEAPYPSP